MRRPLSEEPGIQGSSRTQREAPEFGLLLDKSKPKTTMDNQSQILAAYAIVYLPVAPWTAALLHSEQYEDAEDGSTCKNESPARMAGLMSSACKTSIARKRGVLGTGTKIMMLR